MATITQPRNTAHPASVAARRKTLDTTAKYVLLTLFTLTWLLPILATVLTSFRTMDDIAVNGFWSIPEKFTLEQFKAAWIAARVRQYLLNSFIITIPSLLGMLFLSSLSAYALARFKFKGNLLVYFMYVGGTMLPFQILLLPVFRLTNRLGLYDTYGALILIHIAFQLGFCTFVLRNFMRTVPGEILDAARVDGCGEFRIYWQMMLPLSLPALAALATAAILTFMGHWNEFLQPFIFLNDKNKYTLAIGIKYFQEVAGNVDSMEHRQNILMAASVMMTAPIILLFFLAQRYFVRGIVMSGIKG